MNPIVSAGRHHNERPFTGRHQMSSRILSRGFVRDTFNSPLAFCLPRRRLPLSPFPAVPRIPPPNPCLPTSVSCPSSLTLPRRGKRKKTALGKTGIYYPSLKGVKAVTASEGWIELNGGCYLIFEIDRTNAQIARMDIVRAAS